MLPEKKDTIAITGMKIASRIEVTTITAFFNACLFVSIATAIFFNAAPTVALIKTSPNRKHQPTQPSRLVLH